MRRSATKEQKDALIEGATLLLKDVLVKHPLATVVVIDETDVDNWGWEIRYLNFAKRIVIYGKDDYGE